MPVGWVEIDLAALRHNFYEAKRCAGNGAQILGVVKSDAYGHGMVEVARELEACGVHFFAVGKHREAVELCRAGLKRPVLVLLGIDEPDLEEAVTLGIRPLVYRLDHARALSRTACRMGVRSLYHLKIDTGMGRLGIPSDRIAPSLDELLALPGIEMEGLISHFATADEADKTFSEHQRERFVGALRLLESRGVSVACAHLSNSAGIIDLPNAHFQMARAGIMLYGSPPSGNLLCSVDLRPVMSFKARIMQIKEVPPECPIGYGRTFVTQRTSRIAVIPVGYDDGYPRLLSNRSSALVRGRRVPLVGRISMSMSMLDVTDVPEAREDDETVLLGAQGDERITGDELAALCGTISYEIYCNIGRNRPRYFIDATK